MDHKQALEALLAKVEAGEWPDDYGAAPLLSHLSDCLALAAFEGSLDAAKALHDAVLPGWWCGVRISTKPRAVLGDFGRNFKAYDSNPARAWLCAILKALIAREAE